MFFRKLLGQSTNESPGNSPTSPSNGSQCKQQTMSASLQLRIIIKGDRKVGKTCLFHRLQGLKFIEEYGATEEIKAASIQWNYQSSDDVVKVDIWDIVDKGIRKAKSPADRPLKMLSHAQPEETEQCLDADFVDVFKGTQGVIMMFDLTKPWTYSYVEKELPKVPCNIPTLLLGNQRDNVTKDAKQCVTSAKIHQFIKSIRHHNDAQIRYAESSMKNSYGLKSVHTFFNLPFLFLQRETLLQKLERNKRENVQIMDLMNSQLRSHDQNYEMFQESLISPISENTMKRSQSYNIDTLCPSASLSSSKSSNNVNEMGKRNSIVIESKPTVESSISDSFEESFLDVAANDDDQRQQNINDNESDEDDEEENGANPLVTQIVEDISSEEERSPAFVLIDQIKENVGSLPSITSPIFSPIIPPTFSPITPPTYSPVTPPTFTVTKSNNSRHSRQSSILSNQSTHPTLSSTRGTSTSSVEPPPPLPHYESDPASPISSDSVDFDTPFDSVMDTPSDSVIQLSPPLSRRHSKEDGGEEAEVEDGNKEPKLNIPKPLEFSEKDFAALSCIGEMPQVIGKSMVFKPKLSSSSSSDGEGHFFSPKKDEQFFSGTKSIERKPKKSTSSIRPRTLTLNDSSSCDDQDNMVKTPLYAVTMTIEDISSGNEEVSMDCHKAAAGQQENSPIKVTDEKIKQKKPKKEKKEKKSKKSKKSKEEKDLKKNKRKSKNKQDANQNQNDYEEF